MSTSNSIITIFTGLVDTKIHLGNPAVWTTNYRGFQCRFSHPQVSDVHGNCHVEDECWGHSIDITWACSQKKSFYSSSSSSSSSFIRTSLYHRAHFILADRYVSTIILTYPWRLWLHGSPGATRSLSPDRASRTSTQDRQWWIVVRHGHRDGMINIGQLFVEYWEW